MWLKEITVFPLSDDAVSESVELQTISQVAAQCGNNVTLTCDAVSSHQLDIRSFEWLARDKSVCQNGHGQPDRKVLCERGDHSLTLTLLNVMPDDQGTYLCKLRSTSGSGSKNTVVTVQGELWLFLYLHFSSLSSVIFLNDLNLYRLPWKFWLLHQWDSRWVLVHRSLPRWHRPLVPGRR